MSNLRETIRLESADWSHIQTILSKGTAFERDLAQRIETARTVTDREQAYIDGADKLTRDGEIEVDAGAIISEGDATEKGAYVSAWLWVYKDTAGVFDVGDAVLFDPVTKDGDEHPELEHEFTAHVDAVRHENGAFIYTINDQDDTFDVEGKYLTREY